MFQETSNVAREVDTAFLWIGGVCLLLLIGNTTAMLLFAIRYRRSRARTTLQVKSNAFLETLWVAVPTVIVFWMFYVGFWDFATIRKPPEDAMVVEVTARQWSWSFHYPKEGVDSSEMCVPVGAPVRAVLTSVPNDVIHGFYIPDFRIKEDALPGRQTYVWFKADREGVYNIFCTQFCGKDHSQMRSLLHVVSIEAYAKWVQTQIAKRYKPLEFQGIADPDYEAFGAADLNIDRKALFATYCASCHGAKGDGSGLPGVARDFSQLKGWKHSAKVSSIYGTLMEGIPGTQMRAFPNFTPWERIALAHQVRSFVKDALPTDANADYETMVKLFGLDKIQGPPRSIPIERAMGLLVKEGDRAATSTAARRF